MPYLDLPKDHPHFTAVQRIGATGILRGEGRNVGWANQTWFRADDSLLAEEIFAEDYSFASLPLSPGPVKIVQFMEALRHWGFDVPASTESWWETLGLTDYNPSRVMTRLEAAVIINAAIDPFSMFAVDYDGNVLE